MGVTVPLLPAWIRWLFVILVAGFVLYASVVALPPAIMIQDGNGGPPSLAVEPDPQDPDTTTDGDEVFTILSDMLGFAEQHWRHFLAYGTLAYTLAYASAEWRLRPRHHAVLVIGCVIAYGGLIEVLQHFSTERTFDTVDIAANSVGAMLVIPWYLVRPYVRPTPVSELIAD